MVGHAAVAARHGSAGLVPEHDAHRGLIAIAGAVVVSADGAAELGRETPLLVFLAALVKNGNDTIGNKQLTALLSSSNALYCTSNVCTSMYVRRFDFLENILRRQRQQSQRN